jgi:hypothetical protein
VIFAQVHPSDDRTEVTLGKPYQYQIGQDGGRRERGVNRIA